MDTLANHNQPETTATSPQQYSGQAIASLVLGILSVTAAGLLTGIPALVLGIIDLKKHPRNRGMALAGVITGGIGTLFSLLFIAFIIVMIAIGATSDHYKGYGSQAELYSTPSSRT